MKDIVVAIPHSHSWFWVQSCLASLQRNPPRADGYNVKIVVVDNSPWSPSIQGVTQTSIGDGAWVVQNTKSNKFHASALDCVVDLHTQGFPHDFLVALETDVLALRPDWLQWFVDQMKDTDFAVGAWHHEQFINPSCTLYRSSVLREMAEWCKRREVQNELRWGPNFSKSQPITDRSPEKDYVDWYDDNIGWIAGPFSEKRGWPEGTVLRKQPSGQSKGPGWYEPGQQLYHWAVERGYTAAICPTQTMARNIPLQTLYGKYDFPGVDNRQMEAAELFSCGAKTAHMWGGTRALDIIKHPVHDPAVVDNTPFWLAREARFWLDVVPPGVRARTIELIREHGWYNRDMTDRDRQAVEYVKQYYEAGGVTW